MGFGNSLAGVADTVNEFCSLIHWDGCSGAALDIWVCPWRGESDGGLVRLIGNISAVLSVTLLSQGGRLFLWWAWMPSVAEALSGFGWLC
jgi:hypothetical protein